MLKWAYIPLSTESGPEDVGLERGFLETTSFI